MSTIGTLGNSIKRDIRKDPEALEQEAGEVRADVERTLHDLERRLSPSALLDRGMEVVKQNGGDFGRNLANQVRNNPVPTLLTGVGIAWLMAASDRPPRSTWRDSAPRGRMAAVAAAGTRVAATGTHHAAEHVTHGARAAAHGIGDAGRAVRRGYTYMRREQPLMLRALAVAAGAAIGALLPTGETHDGGMRSQGDDAELRRRVRALREEQRRIMAGTMPRQLEEPPAGPSMSERITSAPGSTFRDARGVTQT
jgi:hypothetical protein